MCPSLRVEAHSLKMVPVSAEERMRVQTLRRITRDRDACLHSPLDSYGHRSFVGYAPAVLAMYHTKMMPFIPTRGDTGLCWGPQV
jgi:hypothetical protein